VARSRLLPPIFPINLQISRSAFSFQLGTNGFASHEGPDDSIFLTTAIAGTNCCSRNSPKSKTNKRAISGSSDGALRVWDLTGKEPSRVLERHKANLKAVALSEDGKRAVSGSSDKTLRIWDLDDGRCLAVFTCVGWVISCAWSGSHIAHGDLSGQVHLFSWEE
jgi:WD40 repeat protein